MTAMTGLCSISAATRLLHAPAAGRRRSLSWRPASAASHGSDGVGQRSGYVSPSLSARSNPLTCVNTLSHTPPKWFCSF